ncbi:hypothetical protein COU37_03975 [Candidatus Micrarchaeota archaeon CG10_big_fil_rev_8_21_14_0_10_45_29]|nr:MAG: hypothetical protein COU37_03975 [Candidatus Micrarchaeota archaeon CG10_big_fil_rev_8_21_14_0_10_45_29]
MAKKYYDVAKGVKFAFKNFRDGELLKWSAFTFFGMVGAVIADMVIMGIILVSLMYIAGQSGGGLDDISFRNSSSVVVIIAAMYLIPRLMSKGMEVNAIKVRQKLPSIVEWFVFSARKAIIDMLCWYDRRLLAPAALFLALGTFCIMLVFTSLLVPQGNNINGNELAVVGGTVFLLLGLVAWLIGAIVHSTRTYFGYYMLLRGEAQEQHALKKSFDVVKGQTFEVFLAGILFVILLLLLWAIAGAVMFALAFIPCIGAIIDLVLVVVLLVITIAINQAYFANVFKFYCPQGGKKR